MRTGLQAAGVLFDLDGTLLDTLEDLADSTNRCLAGLGLPGHPVEAYRYFVGDGIANLSRRTLPAERRDPATVEALQELFNRDYHAHWADKTRPYEGIADLLDDSAPAGSPWPSCPTSPMPSPWTWSPISSPPGDGPPFSAPATRTPASRTRPRPWRSPRPWAWPPREVLYAGDTSTDMQTARNAGMFAVGVLWGFRPRAELVESGAQALVSRPSELLAVLSCSFRRAPPRR